MTISSDVIQLLLTAVVAILAPALVMKLKRDQRLPLPIRDDECAEAVEELNGIQQYLTELLLSDRVDSTDLQTFPFEIAVDYDGLRGEDRRSKAIHLMRLAKRRRILIRLYGATIRLRPDLEKRH